MFYIWRLILPAIWLFSLKHCVLTKTQIPKNLEILAQSQSHSEHIRHLSEIVSDPHIAQNSARPYSKNQDDCFQGIFNTGHHLIQSLFQLREATYPDSLQVSIGIGGVNNTINPVTATDIEGSAIEAAQLALNRAPKSGHYLALSGFSKNLERTLCPTVALLWSTTRSWNLNRLKILNQRLRGESELSIGRQLQISERAVYKNIAQAQLGQWVDLILAVEDSFSRLLSKPSPSNSP